MSAGREEKLNIGSEVGKNGASHKRVDESQRHTAYQTANHAHRDSEKSRRLGRWTRFLRSLGIGTSAEGFDAVPICSFGPGGSYLVDWRVDNAIDASRHGEARTLAAGIERFAECLTLDLKGWLLAEHPERQHRIDAVPETLDGCPLCRHENQWPDWFIKGQSAPDEKAILTGVRIAEDLKKELASDPILAAVVHEAQGSKRDRNLEQTEIGNLEESNVSDSGQGFNISAAIGKAEMQSEVKKSVPVAKAMPEHQPVSGDGGQNPESERINYAEGSWETENTGPFLFKFSDNLEPVSFRLPTTREQSHDPNTQTTQNPDCNSGLSRSERVLTNHAGTGRSAQRLKGNGLRARRGTRAERSAAASPEQGSLFGNQSDGQAA